MIVTSDNFKTSAIKYISLFNGLSANEQDRIADSIVQSLMVNRIAEIPVQDFELIVNQFYNLVCFGPITNLELFITQDCNLSCDYCFVKEKQHKIMPLESIYSSINFLTFYSGNQKNLNLTLFGGEPLMAKKTIKKVVEYISKLESKSKAKKYSISITTNGTLLDEDFLRHTRDKINFLLSIDGDQQTHDVYRKYQNGRGTFNTVVSKIKLLKKYQPWLGARMTVLPDTITQLYHNIVSLYNLGINQILLGPAMDVEWNEKAMRAYEGQLRRVGQFYLKKKQKKEPFRMTLFENNNNGIECHEHQWGCGAGRNTISVNTNGDIYPCSKFLGYEEFDAPELKLGNIYMGIANIELRKKLSMISDSSFPTCVSCKEVNACMGGCPADNYHLHRNIHKAGKAHCRIKEIENRILREMYRDE